MDFTYFGLAHCFFSLVLWKEGKWNVGSQNIKQLKYNKDDNFCFTVSQSLHMPDRAFSARTVISTISTVSPSQGILPFRWYQFTWFAQEEQNATSIMTWGLFIEAPGNYRAR